MTTVLLVRHARSRANADGILAGRQESSLDDTGMQQAEGLATRLAEVPVTLALSSPQLRARQTAERALAGRMEAGVDEAFAECDYGDWTGKALKELSERPEWRAVQTHPSGIVFPGGEAMTTMSWRIVTRLQELTAEHPDGVVWVFSHGDLIKAAIAHALGLHLDGFQRIVIDPASVSVLQYTPARIFVERVNDTGPFRLQRNRHSDSGDAVVGGRDAQ